MTFKSEQYNQGSDIMKKICAVLTVASFILCIVYFKTKLGNPFYMSYAVNSAKKICDRDYNGSLTATGYRFNRDSNEYTVDISDVHGIKSRITYNEKSGIVNDYTADYESVCRNTIRGSFQRRIAKSGIEDVFCSVDVSCNKNGIIGDGGGSCINVYLDFTESENETEFAQKIIAVFSQIKDEDFGTLYAVSRCNGQSLIFESKKANISNHAADLCQRMLKLTVCE